MIPENHSHKCILEEEKYVLDYPCSNQSDCFPYYITLSKGLYLIEVFGAQGGSSGNYGGKGGYASGLLRISSSSMSFYAFIGAKGTWAIGKSGGQRTETAFNGGGSGYAYQDNQIVSSGGGGTDLRTNFDDYGSRIIVAGGGGGSGYHTYYTDDYTGGDGGGVNGIASPSGAEGATEFRPGQQPVPGGFGFGGNAQDGLSNDACGGGGGYFGGAAGKSYAAGGGGGSGFINNSLFTQSRFLTGINTGNGKIFISKVTKIITCSFIDYRTKLRILVFHILVIPIHS